MINGMIVDITFSCFLICKRHPSHNSTLLQNKKSIRVVFRRVQSNQEAFMCAVPPRLRIFWEKEKYLQSLIEPSDRFLT